VISVGQGNRFGHPTPSTLELLRRRGIPVLRTDISGDVELDPRTWARNR
jgi:competence protein ComEC